MLRLRLLALLPLVLTGPLVPDPSVAASAGRAQEGGPAADVAATAVVDPLARVALLGASATAGFNLEAELDGPVRLGAFVAAAAGIDADQVLDGSDNMTFLAPRERTAPGLAAAREQEPSLTLAIDLPFWFVHGGVPESRRLLELEWLLERLEGFPGELFLGTVPAIDDGVSELMVPRRMRATPETVERANRRLAAWAAEREHVHLWPLAELFTGLREGRVPEVRGIEVHPDDVEELLQADGLHPTVLGTALVTLALLDHVDRTLEGALSERVRWDLDALVDAIESR